MIPILSPDGAAVVEALVRARALLVFDLEGALASAPVDDDETPIRPEALDLLRAVSLFQPCAVVSGQSRAEVLRRLPGVAFAGVIGNHGAELAFGPRDRDAERLVAGWRVPLWRSLLGVAGVEIEDRRLSIAIHSRRAPSPVEAERCIAEAIGTLGGTRVVRGRSVVSVIPSTLPSVGAALADLCARLRTECALHVQGTVTGESEIGAAVGRAVRVAPRPGDRAAYSLPDEAAVDDLLRALLKARALQGGPGDRREALVDVAS